MPFIMEQNGEATGETDVASHEEVNDTTHEDSKETTMFVKPTLIIVPGAWQTPWHYHLLVESLQKLSYTVHTLSHSSNSRNGPWTASWEDDVRNVRDAIKDEAGRGNDVVLVMHSYGGAPGSEASKGLLVEDYRDDGRWGGVRGLVYIAAIVLPEGHGVPNEMKGHPEFLLHPTNNSSTHAHPRTILYDDTPEGYRERARQEMVPQSQYILNFRSSFSPWEHIPSHYILTEKDLSIPREMQEMMCSGEGKWTTSGVQTGHSPQLVVPNLVATQIDDFIRRECPNSS